MQKRGRPDNYTRLLNQLRTDLAIGKVTVHNPVAEAPKAEKVAKAPKADATVTIKLKFVPRNGKVTETDKFEVESGGFGVLYLPKGTNPASVRLSR